MIGSNTNCLVLRESEKPGAMFLFEQAEPRKAKTARAVPGAISVRKLTQDESLPLRQFSY